MQGHAQWGHACRTRTGDAEKGVLRGLPAPALCSILRLILYGMQRSVVKKIIAQLNAYADEEPYFILMDENKMGDHDYTDDMAQNRDHLSYAGAQQMTARVESLLRSLKW